MISTVVVDISIVGQEACSRAIDMPRIILKITLNKCVFRRISWQNCEDDYTSSGRAKISCPWMWIRQKSYSIFQYEFINIYNCNRIHIDTMLPAISWVRICAYLILGPCDEEFSGRYYSWWFLASSISFRHPALSCAFLLPVPRRLWPLQSSVVSLGRLSLCAAVLRLRSCWVCPCLPTLLYSLLISAVHNPLQHFLQHTTHVHFIYPALLVPNE